MMKNLRRVELGRKYFVTYWPDRILDEKHDDVIQIFSTIVRILENIQQTLSIAAINVQKTNVFRENERAHPSSVITNNLHLHLETPS